MKERKTAAGLLVAAEIVLLIIVVVMVVMHIISSGNQTDDGRDWSSEAISSHNDTELMFADDSEDSTESTSEDTESSQMTGDIENNTEDDTEEHVTVQIVFSDEVEEKLADMTLEEQVAQMFVTTPEELTGVSQVTISGESTKSAIESYPVGGLVYSSSNFTGTQQAWNLLTNVQSYMEERIGISMFLAIEEDGGSDYSPVASTLRYTAADLPSLWLTADAAQQNADTITSYLSEIGFNLNIGLTTDLNSGMDSIYDVRSLGTDITTVTELLTAELASYDSSGIATAMKYFPEKTSATADGQTGYLVSTRTAEDVAETELVVMSAGVSAGAEIAVVSNVIDSELTGEDNLPCSLSKSAVTMLRDALGENTLIMTDSLSEAVITEQYTVAEAAVAAVNAGADILYLPEDFETAYLAILDGLNDGSIDEALIHNAVGRILTCKFAME